VTCYSVDGIQLISWKIVRGPNDYFCQLFCQIKHLEFRVISAFREFLSSSELIMAIVITNLLTSVRFSESAVGYLSIVHLPLAKFL